MDFRSVRKGSLYVQERSFTQNFIISLEIKLFRCKGSILSPTIFVAKEFLSNLIVSDVSISLPFLKIVTSLQYSITSFNLCVI